MLFSTRVPHCSQLPCQDEPAEPELRQDSEASPTKVQIRTKWINCHLKKNIWIVNMVVLCGHNSTGW